MIYSKKLNDIKRATTITWTNDGDMVLATPQTGNSKNRNNIILKRGSSVDGLDFKESSWVALTRGNACNGLYGPSANGRTLLQLSCRG